MVATEAALGLLAVLLTALRAWAAQLQPRRRPDRRRTHLRRSNARRLTTTTVCVPVVLPGCGLWRRPRKAMTL